MIYVGGGGSYGDFYSQNTLRVPLIIWNDFH